MTILNILILSFILTSLLAFFGGFLVSYGKTTLNKKEKCNELEQIIKTHINSISDLKKQNENLKKQNETPALTKEVEILNIEISNKNREIEELKQNTNRLGKRILEVETELRSTQSNLIQKPADIQDGMDSLLEALQKESDTLRIDLENAYRLIEKQEKEIKQLKMLMDDNTLNEVNNLENIEVLKQQIEELKQERDRYKSLIRQNNIPVI